MTNERPVAGIFPALFTPMHSDGRIDHQAVKTLVDKLFEQKVHGLYVGGSTGEGILLSVQERKEVLESAIEATAGRGCVMVHVGAVATGDTIELAQHAQRVGADAISSVPPFTFGKNRPGILGHYNALSQSCDLPLYLYNIPSLTSVEMNLDLIQELAQLPTVKGMKFSSYNLFAEYRIIENMPDFAVFHGSDETLLYGLMIGAVGGIGLTYNYLPALYVQIYDDFRSRNFARANRLQHLAGRFVDIFLKHSDGNEVGVGKGLLHSYQGIHGGPARLPNLPVAPEVVEKLIADLDQADLLHLDAQTLSAMET